MCLDVEVEHDILRRADPVARKSYRCEECDRAIEPGERYHLEVMKPWGERTVDTMRMCGHCWGTIELGSALTGCPRNWYVGEVHNPQPDDGGFVGDILTHELTVAGRMAMLRTIVGRRHQWRKRDGSLFPLPVS